MQSVAPGQEPTENEIYVELLAPAEHNRVKLPAGSKLWLPRAVVKSMMVRGLCKPTSTEAPAEVATEVTTDTADAEVEVDAAEELVDAEEPKSDKPRGLFRNR